MVKRLFLLSVTLFAFTLWIAPAAMTAQGTLRTYLPVTERGNGYVLPDGNLILYKAGYENGSNLFLSPPPPSATSFQLTRRSTPEGVDYPLFSPDGAYVLYDVSNSGESAFDFWIVGATGAPNFPLVKVEVGGITLPKWGPDSRTIAFAAFPTGSDSSIGYTANIESRSLITLTTELREGPIWDHASTYLYYSVFNANGTTEDLYRINADGTQPTLILASPGRIVPLDVFPDGRILVRINDGTNDDLHLVTPDGSSVTPLTSTPSGEGFPLLSPDGDTIFFGQGTTLYLIDTTGDIVWQYTFTCPVGHTCFPSFDYRAWSPDGAEYAFVWVEVNPQTANYRYQLFTVAADGSQAQPTMILGEGAREVAYSPDGRYFAYDVDLPTEFQVIQVVDRTTQSSSTLSIPNDDLYLQGWRPLP